MRQALDRRQKNSRGSNRIAGKTFVYGVFGAHALAERDANFYSAKLYKGVKCCTGATVSFGRVCGWFGWKLFGGMGMQ